MSKLSINEMMNSGRWVVILKDNSKWVIDLDNNTYDNYEWYTKVGTLESELINKESFLKEAKTLKKIK